MAVATSILVGSAIAAGASAGSAIYAANKQSGAAENAAKTQSDAAVKSAKLQTDSADRQAAIQAQSAKEALDYSRGQSQLSLDQYNQQQQRLNPYRNLGNFALGQPMEQQGPPLQLPTLPGHSGQPAPQQQQQGGGQYPVSTDPSVMAQQTQESFKRMFGRDATPDEVNAVLHYAGKPDQFSDGTWHVGVNDYWVARIGNKSASADPKLAGTQGLISGPNSGSGMASGAAPALRQLVTLGYKPTATPLVKSTPLTAALEPPKLRYKPLGSIGDY